MTLNAGLTAVQVVRRHLPVVLIALAAALSAVGGILVPPALSPDASSDPPPAGAEPRREETWLRDDAVPLLTPVAAAEEPAPSPEQTEAPPMPAPAPVAGAAAAVVPAPALATYTLTGRIRIPAIGVDAPLITIGIAPGGVMQAPPDDVTVGWYHFTAEPGAPGNALVAGHVDWIDHAAVFWHLKSLKAGDVIAVGTPGGQVEYVVERTYTVPYDLQDVTPIVGTRSGRSTLTLITCEGTFNRVRHEYEKRLVVVAGLRGA